MRLLSLSSWSLVLSLISLVQGDILEDHGYQVQSWNGTLHVVFSPKYYDNIQFLNVIAFRPESKIATIRVANNEKERHHTNKLSLAQIFTALAGVNNLEPDDMRWVILDVNEDLQTDKVIDGIRKSHNLKPKEEVKILPGDEEWDTILGTQYYEKVTQIINKPVQKILLRNQDRRHPRRGVEPINRILFSFPVLEEWGPTTGAASDGLATETQSSLDDEEQEAALRALFADEEEKEPAFQAAITCEVADRTLAAKKNSKRKIVRF
ncbi:hypothetical protein Cpir12675_002929 [Ceratocystis pirilliformis]|uniref:Uncharacterized protein n=1 Tax=Ceratocystis pirilliformis TaxID=259994 RepID=A0ABR3Z6G7_9PEZI